MEQFNDINMLINTISCIYDVYLKLYILESKGKKNSEEYSNLLNDLRRLAILEESILKRMDSSIIKFIKEEYNSELSIKVVLKNDKDNLIKARLINDLFLVLTLEKEELVTYYFLVDLMKLCLKILETSNSRNIELRHIMWFSFKELEIEALKNNFNLPSDTYLVHTMLGLSDYSKNSMLLDFYKMAMDIIISDDNELIKTFAISLARAVNVLLNKEISLDLIESLKRLMLLMDDKEKEDIKQIVDNYQCDARIPAYLSLKKKL